MRSSKLFITTLFILLAFHISVNSQITQPVNPSRGTPVVPYNGWRDPALNHNKLLQNQVGDGVYTLIGNWKVIGSPYLFGPKHKADILSVKEKAYNILISYNTYNQDVEFFSSSNPTTPLVKEAGDLDSFIIKKDEVIGINDDLKFIYGSHLGNSEKAYFQLLEKGTKYSLYKRYKTELGHSSTNYIQPDLRQFDMTVDYFYYDEAKKSLKKLKFNVNNIIKEFKSVKDLDPVADKEGFSANPEAVTIKMFAYLNN